MKKIVIVSALLAAFPATNAVAGDEVRARLTGYQEVPSVSTVASGRFEADIHRDGQAFDWELEYSGLQGTVQQAHIHFAQKSVNGAIVVWLCGTGPAPTPTVPNPLFGPPETQTCPQAGTVRGTAMAANVGPGSADAAVDGAGDRRSDRRDALGRRLRQRAHDHLARRRDPRPGQRLR